MTTAGTTATATTSITRSARRSPTRGACTTCTGTSPSGCWISTCRTVTSSMRASPSRTPSSCRPRSTRAWCAAVPGLTTPTGPAARLGWVPRKDWKAQDPQIPQSVWYLTDAEWVGFRVVRPLAEAVAGRGRQVRHRPGAEARYARLQGNARRGRVKPAARKKPGFFRKAGLLKSRASPESSDDDFETPSPFFPACRFRFHAQKKGTIHELSQASDSGFCHAS